ncbi:MAG: sugar ABC transporter permease [Jatrophihabitans sp.]|uniref:sugar ABC transporter permease n=1 Tax=Jatrophihabitans sp. TaxID=1932789 RepID=UPI003F7FF8B2
MTSLDKSATPEADETTTAAPEAATLAVPPGALGEKVDLRTYVHNYFLRVRGGDMGSLPAIGGLVVLVIIFLIAESNFGSLYNFANMFREGTSTIFIAMGLVFVLLLGEIDLAAGYTAGICASVMARLMDGYGWKWYGTIPAAVICGLVIGLAIGVLVAKLRIPSFVVTLSFFLAFQGVVLLILSNGKGQHGQITLSDSVINGFANNYMPLWAGWVLAAVVIVGYGVQKMAAQAARRRQGLAGEPAAVLGFKVGALAVIALLVVWGLNQNRAQGQAHRAVVYVNHKPQYVTVKPPPVEGVPYVIPVLLVLFVVLTFLLTRTRYGRHVYAVGGNAEAARRAGINVDRVRISVFAISAMLAAIGGIMISSFTSSTAANAFGGNTLLLAVGAAVIGGTSLFGGRGRIVDAIIGGAVVEVIYNGFGDLFNGNNNSAIQLIAVGLALLLAAAVDALSRRRAGASGLA